MMSREEIIKEIEELKKDEQLISPTATVFENAPLALIQFGKATRLNTLEYVLGVPLTNVIALRNEAHGK